MLNKLPEQYRIRTGQLASTPEYGANGAFLIPCPPPRVSSFRFLVICSNGGGWEHVSVSIYDSMKKRTSGFTPTWEDMCFVKNQFWSEDEAVIQFHPPKSLYINNHNHCLHLWRCTLKPPYDGFPLPHPFLVGVMGFEIGEKGHEMLAKMSDAMQEETRRKLLTGDWRPTDFKG